MNDLLPGDSARWQWVEGRIIDVMQRYGYKQIRFPIAEKTELFCRSIGEVTDIVEKEMYTFNDRSGESITLRPEGTAGCVRAAMQHNLLETPQRLWYQGPMFRYERPQKGRSRQFHQFGVEIFGLEGPDIDAELIAMTAQFWHELGVSDALTLQLNSLGTATSRAAHRSALVAFFNNHINELDDDSKRRLTGNPLRILDSKNVNTQAIASNAPQLIDYLSDEELVHFKQLQKLLTALNVNFQINPRLVRGLDYYTHTVFEWVTNQLGAQGTVLGGGRYNGLVQQLGSKKPVAGLGFGMGIERLVLLVEACNSDDLNNVPTLDAYFIIEDIAKTQGMQLAQTLRQQTTIQLQTHCGGGSIKSQMKKADKSMAKFALILGQNEVTNSTVTIKPLRAEMTSSLPQQIQMSEEELIQFFKETLISPAGVAK